MSRLSSCCVRAGRLCVGALFLGLAATAAGHVAPSEGENNRYVTLTPMGDRLRLSYTVLFGDKPGRQARRRMDRDGNGTISKSESERHLQALAEEVSGRLYLAVDGRGSSPIWSERSMDLGDRNITGGSFAVDLVAWACFSGPADGTSEHSVEYKDALRLPVPGESELSVIAGPGIRIVSSKLGDRAPGTQDKFRWQGGPGPAAQGLELVVSVDRALATTPGQPCPPPAISQAKPAPTSRRKQVLFFAGTALLLAAAAWLFKGVRTRTGS